jgi:hypothetical protein
MVGTPEPTDQVELPDAPECPLTPDPADTPIPPECLLTPDPADTTVPPECPLTPDPAGTPIPPECPKAPQQVGHYCNGTLHLSDITYIIIYVITCSVVMPYADTVRGSTTEASAWFHTPVVIRGWLPRYHTLELRGP